jgi:HD-GYP domain-containing protein (c-di-GMP phosphodiesterase class II)
LIGQNYYPARIDSVVKFRQLQNEPPTAGKQRVLRESKLRLRELAREQQRAVPAEHAQQDPRVDERRKAVYDKAALYLNHVLAAVRQRKAFTLEPGFKIVREMANVAHTQDFLFVMAIHSENRFKYVIHHCVNVAVYAIKMTQSLGWDPARQIEIGMAALMHDIGMGVIPDKMIYKEQELTAEETRILRERPNYSYKILRSFGKDVAYLAECAAQVYERIDGSGYPRGLKGDEIHEYAQIVGLLDMYEALIHSRPQREKVPHFTAVKEIFNTCKERFQRVYLKELLNVFTVFPIYSYVRLNSGAIGKVIETYSEQPMRPKLLIVLDSQKRPVLTHRIVSLSENPLLNIVDSVSESELPKIVRR